MNDRPGIHPWITPVFAACLAFGSIAASRPASAFTPAFDSAGSVSPDEGGNMGAIEIEAVTLDTTGLGPDFVPGLAISGLFEAHFVDMTQPDPSASGPLSPSESANCGARGAGGAPQACAPNFYGANLSKMPEAETWITLLVGLGMMAPRLSRTMRCGPRGMRRGGPQQVKLQAARSIFSGECLALHC